MNETELHIPEEVIASKIFNLRDLKVMLDSDLAELYQVETKRLNEQVKRNEKRFPTDFMFQLTEGEWDSLKSQNATTRWGGRRTLPYAFTEHGVLMLSSVLNSDRAIAVNIKVIRVYNKLKEILLTHKDLLIKMEELENKVAGQDDKLIQVFNYLKQFIQQQEKSRPQIGFKS